MWTRLFILKSYLAIAFLLTLVSLLTHHYIFTQKGILSSGDWVHFYPQAADTLENYSIYYKSHNFGEIMPFPNNWPFYLLASKLMAWGYSFDFFTRLFFLGPIIVFTPIFSFLAFKKISKNTFIAFFSSLIYCYNPFFLKLQLDWLTYASMWWVLALLVYLVLSFSENRKSVILPIISLVIGLGMVYEIRIMLVIFVFLGIYLLNLLLVKKYSHILLLACSFLFGILIHLYWIIPFIFGGVRTDLLSYASSEPFVSFFNLLDVMLLRSYQWRDGLVHAPFVRQGIDSVLFIIPAFSALGLYAHRNSVWDKTFIRTSLISLVIFVFLSKQANVPGPHIYNLLFKYVPLFSLFRESSKFIIIVGFCLSIFFGYGVNFAYIKIRSYKIIYSKALIVVLTILILSNTRNYINSTVGYMTKAVQIPLEYEYIKNYLIKDSAFNRVFWYPFKPRFGYFTENKPYVLADFIKSHMGQSDLFNYPVKLNRFLDYTSVKYVIIPPATEVSHKNVSPDFLNDNDAYKDYGSRGKYITAVEKQSFLTKVEIPNNGIRLYVNKNSLPNIYASSFPISLEEDLDSPRLIKHKQISPYLYQINASDMNAGEYLHFSDSFNHGWELIATSKTNNINLNTQYTALNKDYHIKNDAGVNTFMLPDEWLNKIKLLYKEPTLYIYYKNHYWMTIGNYLSKLVLGLIVTAIFTLTIADKLKLKRIFHFTTKDVQK